MDITTEYYVFGHERIAQVISRGTGSQPARIYPNEATFFLYDHLGNTRVSFQHSTANVLYPSTIVNAMDYYPYGKVLREFDNGDGDRYLTTGHERDQETGLDYRGARYYDSDVARFLSLDPMASIYPMMSAYNYVAGNPIVFIDPNGREIVFAEDLTRSQKREYKKQLRYLKRNSETFARMYKDLKNAENTYTLAHTDEANHDHYDPATRTIYVNLNGNDYGQPVATSIAHELGHSFREEMKLDAEESTYGELSIETAVYNKKAELYMEFEGLHIENIVRSELGLPLRDVYGDRNDHNANNTITLHGKKYLDYSQGKLVTIERDSDYDYQDRKKDHYKGILERKVNGQDLNPYNYEKEGAFK